MTHSEFYHPAFFEEIAGPFSLLVEQDDALEVRIGRVRLSVPKSMEQSLRPLLDQSISIIRTDIVGKEFLVRVIKCDSPIERTGWDCDESSN